MDDKAAAIERQIDETLAGLKEKLGKLENELSGTFNSVKDSVTTVRDTLNVNAHVRRRPWTFIAGAAAVGILGGLHTNGRDTAHGLQNGKSANTPPADQQVAQHKPSANNGSVNGTTKAPSWLAALGHTFEPEIAELKGIAIGTLLGMVREMMKSSTSMQTVRPGDKS